MKKLVMLGAVAMLAACSGYQATPIGSAGARSSVQASNVEVLLSPPTRAYRVIGIVSADRYRPGFRDPNIADAIPYLRAAGAELGADAVIVKDRNTPWGGRTITVEAEAIIYEGE